MIPFLESVWEGHRTPGFAQPGTVQQMARPTLLLVPVSPSPEHKDETKIIRGSTGTLGFSGSVDFSEMFLSLKEVFSSSIHSGLSSSFELLFIPKDSASQMSSVLRRRQTEDSGISSSLLL